MRLGEVEREEEGCRVGLVNEFTTFYLCLMREKKEGKGRQGKGIDGRKRGKKNIQVVVGGQGGSYDSTYLALSPFSLFALMCMMDARTGRMNRRKLFRMKLSTQQR